MFLREQDLDGSQAAQTSGMNSVNVQRPVCRTESTFSVLSNQNNALGPFDSVKI